MAETIAKIKVRQGNLADLPILSPGEQGYALDANRMFVGNLVATLGSGTGSQTEFGCSVDLDIVPVYEVRVNGSVVNPAEYTIDNSGTVISFAAAPALGESVELAYNTEILTYQPDREDDVPTEVTLEAPSTTIPQLAIDQTRYNNGEIKYSIRDDINGHVRTGTVTFALMNGTARLSDNYVVCDDAHLPHEFSGTWNGDVYTFNATTTSTEEVTLTFITNLWKS